MARPVRLAGLCVALLVVLSACDWTVFGDNPARTRSSPDSSISADAVGTLTAAWTATGGGASSPAVANGRVYVGSGDHHLYAFDAATGASVWSVTAAGGFSSPAVANGIVYVGSDDHKVYAFDATTGATAWTVTTGDAVESSPAVVSGIVYVGSDDHTVYALNAATGAIVWTATTGNSVFSSPAIANGIVYVGSLDGKVWALNATTGATVWSVTTGGAVESSPAVANGVAYVGSLDGKVWALDATTGATIWTTTTTGGFSSPAVANGTVYVGSDVGKVWALNATTGATVWSVTTGGAVESSPAVANGIVYVGSDDHDVYAFDTATGATVWTATTGNSVFSSPAVANGTVYAGSSNDTLWAFSPCANAVASHGLAACDIQNAYRLPSAVLGTGKTVAIVDAYDDPTAASDLAVYRSTMRLPPCTTANGCFRKVNQQGAASPLPSYNKGWALEISLDLDMVSATCPNCRILLVEASSASIADLAASVDTAAAQGASVVSNSYGTRESSALTAYDAHYRHSGIPVVVASGDCGYGAGPQWPAVIPAVTAVGGTALTRAASSRGYSETVWNATSSTCSSQSGSTLAAPGSGCSAYETKPSWQSDSLCPRRTVADVAAVAANLAVYDTSGYSGWVTVGGTSAATPIIASADALGGSTAGPSDVYAHGNVLFDVTTGNNGSCSGTYLCTAAVGFDGPTGLGTPCGVGAFGGVIGSPAGCGGSASTPSAAPAPAASGPLPTYTPACGAPPPGEVRCFAFVQDGA
jgi:outer membrane protein assembly factor BamB